MDDDLSLDESTNSKVAEEEEEEESKTEKLSAAKKQLKRYIILSKIPCNLNAQLCILRVSCLPNIKFNSIPTLFHRTPWTH